MYTFECFKALFTRTLYHCQNTQLFLVYKFTLIKVLDSVQLKDIVNYLSIFHSDIVFNYKNKEENYFNIFRYNLNYIKNSKKIFLLSKRTNDIKES